MTGFIATAPDDGLPPGRRWRAVFSITMGTLLLMMDSSIANVGLPAIARDLHIPGTDSVMVVTGYNLVLAMMLMPFAALGSYLGLRRVFLAGLCAYIAGGIFSWFAQGLWLLLAARGVQALGAAAAMSVGSALVRFIYPRHQLGRGLGFNTLAAAIGGAIAPVVGGIIIAHLSWHFVFVTGIPLAVAALLGGRALPAPQSEARSFDLAGSLLCAVTFGLLISGLRCLTAGAGALLPAGLLLAGSMAAFLLIRHELGVPHPALPVDLFRQPVLSLSVAAAFCAYITSNGVLLALPFHLYAAGYGAAKIGTVIMPYALAASISAPVSGMLSDRFSPTALGTAGLGTAIIALLLLARVPVVPSYAQLALPIALAGMGFGSFMSPNARLIIGAVDPMRASSASSLVSTTRMISQAVASTIVGILLALGTSLRAEALAAAALATLAALLSLARLKASPPASR